ncbi:MAG: EVE domain-containing protein [Runella slithyformis]|jgi:predicted RNA-binding protein with PUA-like domain|nr:MAG: EVE domain-containing protein [Runella slithyformis]TAF96453.1 MAG: EVE domain-containing protein [Runella sp.]TAG18443.1 MAG: EVE domain-containing protein [Cytophagales bacterium]TAG39738.1 MAG: EVE domain-containing protein [Cytophagia bacterium]TAF23073.1 MAG: EVE domain-containing protein [Runella slithyformis]
MNHWLVKSEPFVYSYDDLQRDGRGTWDGVRNYQARNNLQAMRLNDLVLFYHSNEGLAVVGVAQVMKEAYPDPTTDDARWVVVDLAPVLRLDRPVTLAQIKTDNRLNEIALIKQSRLSVMPIKPQEFDLILSLGTHENN